MLPTKGYFQDIQCPYLDSVCGRPYCHFRHRKKAQESEDNFVETEQICAVPSYKPTPKSELVNNKSHIPISYIPDMIFRPGPTRPLTRFAIEKPTYKPTPISVLESNKSKDGTEEKRKKESEYDPTAKSVFSIEYKPTPIEENVEKVSEYSPTSNSVFSFEYKPSPLVDISENSDSYKPAGNNKTNAEYVPTVMEDDKSKNSLHEYKPAGKISTDVQYVPTAVDDDIDFENLTSEFDMIDKLITCTSEENVKKITPKNDGASQNSSTSNKNTDTKTTQSNKNFIGNISEKSEESKDILIGSAMALQKVKTSSKSSEEKNNKKSTKKIKEKRKSDDHRKKSDKRDGHDSKESKHRKEGRSHKSSHKDKHGKDDRKNSEGEKNRSEERKRRHGEKNDGSSERNKKSGVEREKHVKSDKKRDGRKSSEEKRKNKKNGDHDKTKGKTNEIKKRKNSAKDSSEDEKRQKRKHKVDKVKTSRKKKNGSDSSDNDETSDEGDSGPRKHKAKNKVKKRYNTSDSSASSDSDEISSKSKSDRTKLKSIKTTDSNLLNSDSDGVDSIGACDVGIDSDLDDRDETMLECYKIFNEYNPSPKVLVEAPNEVAEEEPTDVPTSKKRIAHTNAENFTKIHQPKSNNVVSAAQTMVNRFKIAKEMQAANEEKNIIKEMGRYCGQSPSTTGLRPAKRPSTTPPTLLEAAKKFRKEATKATSNAVPSKTITSLVDDIINEGKNKPKKIAPVQNVLNIQRAKAQLEEMAKHRASQVINRTVAQVNKSGRQAHVPEYTLADIPDVLEAAKSKLPVNVRTRFLTMIADECSKLYISKEGAFKRALDEEFACYQKCKVLLTYRNSAMLAVNRLRKEIQERQQKGLGLIDLETKKNDAELRGRQFYKIVQKFVLSEEELDIHGFPRESAVPGRAVIKNRKVPQVSLPKNQRKCARCSKIYLVDDNDFVIYPEECIYHPLKKRTLRGERTYLCCKSSDDLGCATSHSHVCDLPEDAELEGYQATMKPEREDDPRSYAVYALDCEMCYTTKGLELTRVTIVDAECKTVYESLVKPLNPIVDYNTTFSGITKQQMDKTSTGILQVQANILHLCNSKTILIGHSLESDMKALKIIHGSIIDTSVLFPHKMGLPHKRALRNLASEYLSKIIQNNVSGHDSAEDAITCMELLKWKIKEELKTKGTKLSSH